MQKSDLMPEKVVTKCLENESFSHESVVVLYGRRW
ncbi:hypothetical protein BDL97_18G006200 [Sphagnum fallax]|nr:hypothetical protein BDL97_18G006200 [Sphagnum fallax]